jgi:hypothetical protein
VPRNSLGPKILGEKRLEISLQPFVGVDEFFQQ